MWTVTAATVLAVSVGRGLLGRPDMMIAGNGSWAESLTWFSDRLDGPLPQPWVVSVPLLAYRLVMLAWSLWLALARDPLGALDVGLLQRARPVAPAVPAAGQGAAAAARGAAGAIGRAPHPSLSPLPRGEGERLQWSERSRRRADVLIRSAA